MDLKRWMEEVNRIIAARSFKNGEWEDRTEWVCKINLQKFTQGDEYKLKTYINYPN